MPNPVEVTSATTHRNGIAPGEIVRPEMRVQNEVEKMARADYLQIASIYWMPIMLQSLKD